MQTKVKKLKFPLINIAKENNYSGLSELEKLIEQIRSYYEKEAKIA